MTDDKRELAAMYLMVALDFVRSAQRVVGLDPPSGDLSAIIIKIKEVGQSLVTPESE